VRTSETKSASLDRVLWDGDLGDRPGQVQVQVVEHLVEHDPMRPRGTNEGTGHFDPAPGARAHCSGLESGVELPGNPEQQLLQVRCYRPHQE